MTDQTRVKFQGLSAEMFDRAELGDEVVFTVRGVVVKDEEATQAHEGIRRSQTVRVERVVEGVSKSVHDSEDGQMSLADVEPDDDEDDPDIAPDDDPAPDEDDSNTYPAFSGAQA